MGYVALRFDGCYVHVSTPRADTVLRADGTVLGPGSVLERLDLRHGRVAFRVLDGRYLARTAGQAGVSRSIRLTGELSAAAAFEELRGDGDAVCLRSCDGLFVGVGAGGAVVADRVSNGSREQFSYVRVDAEAAGRHRAAAGIRLPQQAVRGSFTSVR